ncbi:MAG: PaaI family thioesterase [Clostridia bacterium]|nr:PaaI family thioesterase [Clostridia bacterium]
MEKRFAPSGAVGALLPFTLIRCSAKEASLEVAYVPEPWVRNMNGTIHGGILMTLFDSAMGTLVKCFTGEMSTPTLNLSVNFSSPGYLSNTLRFAVHIEHCGAHSVQLQGRCYPENDPERTVATAQGVFFRA